jgi:diguanylate cyclase (GGDEF)-like protein
MPETMQIPAAVLIRINKMSQIIRTLSFLDRQNKVTLWGIIILLLLGLGGIDYVTGAGVSIAFFYLIPISLASWSLGKTPGLIAATSAAIIWQASNLLAGGETSSPFAIIWNTFTHLGIFLIFATLLSEFHILLQHQTELSRTDSLTGILNRRVFYEGVSTELKKIDRYQRLFTVASIVVDNFKSVNDASGHLAGDALLVRVAECINHHLRGTDIVARLGGDEYAVLMPETDEAAAEKAIPRIQMALINEMAAAKWPVTFSMGVLTCNAAPPSVQDTLHLADQLMYTANRCGKNRIEYGSYPNNIK